MSSLLAAGVVSVVAPRWREIPRELCRALRAAAERPGPLHRGEARRGPTTRVAWSGAGVRSRRIRACSTVDRVTLDGDVSRSRELLNELLGRVREGRAISDLLTSEADPELVTENLRPLGRDHAVIESIAGSDERVDAVVTAGNATARVVFAHTAAGLLTWLDVYLRPDRFDGIAGGRIIVVNGPSGAGKSTLMRALQSVATFPLVVLDEPEEIGTVQPGYLIWRDRAPSLHRGYLAAIATLARAGNHVAVSAAGHPHLDIADAFEDMFVVTVGLTCEFEVLCERERRTGRWAGIAAESLGAHHGWTYDLEFDTTDDPDPLDLAQLVLDRLER